MISSQLTLRQAEEADLAQIIAADKAVFGWYGAQEDPQIIAARLRVYPQGSVVLELHGRFVGYATAEKWSSLREPALDENPQLTHDPGGCIFNITTLAVLPEQQRGGLGKVLLDRLIEIAQSEGCSQIVLETAHAEAWYARHGFYKLSERSQRGIQLAVMGKSLLRPQIGALLIGQSPRADLVDPLRLAIPQADILEFGALDGLHGADLAQVETGAYPLTTRLRDGTGVTVAEAFLEPRLQAALVAAEAKGVDAAILLCAGSFAKLHSAKPLFKPFELGRTVLQNLGVQRLGLLCPIPEQEPPIGARWRANGFTVRTYSAPPSPHNAALQRWMVQNGSQFDCLVLDYVGHPPETAAQMQQEFSLPVLDLGQLAIQALATLFK